MVPISVKKLRLRHLDLAIWIMTICSLIDTLTSLLEKLN
jgi:hypothetical protein